MDGEQMNAEEIYFEEIRPVNSTNRQGWDFPKESRIYPKPIPGKYRSLYTEMKIKCNPNNWMEPYNYEKVALSTELMCQIEANKCDDKKLIELRQMAVKELGIRISTAALYEELIYKLDPRKYSENVKHMQIVNRFYHQVLLNADKIEKLENIQRLAMRECESHGITLVDEKKDVEKSEVSSDFVNVFFGVFFSLIIFMKIALLGLS